MILHIFNNQKKFSKGYFEFLKNSGFDLSNHQLIHYGKPSTEYQKIGLSKVIFINSFISPSNIYKLKKYMVQADKIVVHSMASPYLIFLLGVYPKLAQKVFWVMWGKDLYFYHILIKKRFYHAVYEQMRIRAIKNIGHIVGIFDSECLLVQKWYKTSAVFYTCNCLYPYSLGNNIFDISNHSDESNITILLGNSASPTNNHLAALDQLYNCKNQIKTIYCPLSYNGKKGYIKKVMDKGRSLFGDSFVGLTDFIDKQAYFDMLHSVDVGYFYYDRQEGLGNIVSLILNGKTIYLKNGTTTYDFFNEKGIKIIDSEANDDTLHLLSPSELIENKERLEPFFCSKYSLDFWRKILE